MTEDTKPKTEEHLRLFVAIAIPEKVKKEIERTQTELRSALRESLIKWTRPDQFHLTVRFLGKVEEERLDGLVEAVQDTCQGSEALDLWAGSIGCFPNLRKPRVIWVKVEDEAGQLVHLHRRIQAATQKFTTEEPEERFTGHVTLGRVKAISRNEGKALAEIAAKMRERVLGEWQAREIEIMRSELSPEGARHSHVAGILFQARTI